MAQRTSASCGQRPWPKAGRDRGLLGGHPLCGKRRPHGWSTIKASQASQLGRTDERITGVTSRGRSGSSRLSIVVSVPLPLLPRMA